jgi:hypothetical protein
MGCGLPMRFISVNLEKRMVMMWSDLVACLSAEVQGNNLSSFDATNTKLDGFHNIFDKSEMRRNTCWKTC